MSDLIVIVYPTESRAEEVRQKLVGLEKEYLIELSDAVIAVKQDNGKVKLHQLNYRQEVMQAVDTVYGGFWGLLIGAVFRKPLSGASLGATEGALAGALLDFGIDDAFMTQLAFALQPGNAALFLLIRKMTTDKVLEDIEGTGGKVLRTSLDHAKEQALRNALAASPPDGTSLADIHSAP